MALLSKQFLNTLGIELDDASSEAFSQHFEDTLNSRVIEEIIDILEDDQLEQLTALRDNGDDEALQNWLVENVPDLSEIIQDEVAILLGEIVENSDEI